LNALIERNRKKREGRAPGFSQPESDGGVKDGYKRMRKGGKRARGEGKGKTSYVWIKETGLQRV